MKIDSHITELLRRHNCVIVPEFGGFIANYESAWINRSRGLIYPPFKQILFNGNLTQNDGLLANEIVQKEIISYADALSNISAQVKDWRKQLNEGARIELGEIGFLFSHNEQIVFEQNREVNLLLQAYGLKQVSFVDFSNIESQKSERMKFVESTKKLETISVDIKKTIAAVSTEVEKPKIVAAVAETPVIALNTAEKIQAVEVEKEDPKIIPITVAKKRRNYKYAVAAAVILPALFYSYWIPMKTNFLNTGKIQMSDFNPFNKQANAQYSLRKSVFEMDLSNDWKSWEELTQTLPQDVSIYNLELDDETFIPVKLKENSESNLFNGSGAYNLIAGCFSVEANAVNFVSTLNSKGYSAGIVDQKNGLYRVSAGSFGSETEAESALDKFKTDGFSGWVLKP